MVDPLKAATQQALGILSRRIRDVDNKVIAEASNSAPSVYFADLPDPTNRRGWMRYVRDGRKVGEGAGAGTGCLAYSDGVAWRRSSDDTTVAN